MHNLLSFLKYTAKLPQMENPIPHQREKEALPFSSLSWELGLKRISAPQAPAEPNGHGNSASPDNRNCHARFPHPPQAREGANESLREFHFNGGFTLIELVITVAIVGLLAMVALPMAELGVQRFKEHELHYALREIRTALDAYKRGVDEGWIEHSMGKSGYPPSLKALVEGVTDTRVPDGKSKIYFLRRIPRDPMFSDPAIPGEETWGKRSYESSHDAPEEGEDVFDVYSLSPVIGLNGIAYRNW